MRHYIQSSSGRRVRKMICDRASIFDNQPVALYMVIERFKKGDPVPIYRRFHERGRLMPDGLTYISSWVEPTLDRCYQVMETADPALLERWMAHWRDLVEFEVREVITSAEAAARVTPRL